MTIDLAFGPTIAAATGIAGICLAVFYEQRNERFRDLTAKCFAVQGNALIDQMSRTAAIEEHLGVEIELQDDDNEGGEETPEGQESFTSSAALPETGE